MLVPVLAGLFYAWPARSAEIVVSWVETQHRVRPTSGTSHANKSIQLSLQGGNVISEHAVAVGRRGQTSERKSDGNLGKTIALKQSRVAWRVKDDNTLVREWDRPQHVETLEIRVTNNSCRAAIAYRLKPGFTEYRQTIIRTGEPAYLRAVEADRMTCTVRD
jgi:hypothetical protein